MDQRAFSSLPHPKTPMAVARIARLHYHVQPNARNAKIQIELQNLYSAVRIRPAPLGAKLPPAFRERLISSGSCASPKSKRARDVPTAPPPPGADLPLWAVAALLTSLGIPSKLCQIARRAAADGPWRPAVAFGTHGGL